MLLSAWMQYNGIESWCYAYEEDMKLHLHDS